MVMRGNEDIARRYGDALMREIRAEMARHDVSSVRGLAELTGMNHATLNSRLNRDSRTGKRVPLGQEDLWRIAEALDVNVYDLVRRASAAVTQPPQGHQSAG